MTKQITCLFMVTFLVFGAPLFSQASTIKVGYNDTPPIGFAGTDGEVKGVFADVLNLIAQKEGWTLAYLPGTWQECLNRLENTQIDLLIAIAKSEERDLLYDFNKEPVIANWGIIYTRAGDELLSTMELGQRKIGVVKADIFYLSFQAIARQLGIAPEYVEVGSFAEIVEMLDTRRVDAGILPRIFGTYHERSHPISKSSISFHPADLYIAAPKGWSQDLLAAIDRNLLSLKQNRNSGYYHSLDRWIEGVNRVAFPPWLQPLWVLAFLGGFIAFILLGNIILRRRVSSRTAALERTISAKEQIESELKIAHEIQMQSIPAIFPPFPDRDDLDIYAILQPAREVGGDFYDFFFLDDTRICLFIGDVSGKGVPAALFVSAVKTLTKATTKLTHHPATLLTMVNQELVPGNESCTFVTLFFGILNLSNGELIYTNAGHNAPLLLRSDGTAEYFPESNSTIVGIDAEARYRESTVMLSPGEIIFLYTDGITEASSSDEELFTEERLEREITAFPRNSMESLVKSMQERIERFSEGMPQTDDITILALRYFGLEGSLGSITNVDLENDLTELERLAKIVTHYGNVHYISDEVVGDIQLVLEEIIANIILYGYDDERSHLINVLFNLEGPALHITITDDAKPFNPLESAEPDIDSPFEEREIGGLGIFLSQKFMDELDYERRDDKNILSMRKNLLRKKPVLDA